MPVEVRTFDWREADYALVRATRREYRDDYINSKTREKVNAFNTLNELWLCSADGSAKTLLSTIKMEPNAIEYALTERYVDGKTFWEKISWVF